MRGESQKRNGERAAERNTSRTRPEQLHPATPSNYWNRIADDVASGYGALKSNKRKRNSLWNEDQLPDDHERGDA